MENVQKQLKSLGRERLVHRKEDGVLFNAVCIAVSRKHHLGSSTTSLVKGIASEWRTMVQVRDNIEGFPASEACTLGPLEASKRKLWVGTGDREVKKTMCHEKWVTCQIHFLGNWSLPIMV